MKRTPLKRYTPLKARKRTLRIAGTSTSSELKREIQAILREIVIKRDGGCFLRHYRNKIQPQYVNCGSYRNDGQLILQAEHLHSRANANSFSDSRLVVCCCQRHHIYYKAQYGDEYYRIVKKHIGPQRTKLLEKVQADHSPHKVDLKLELLALKQELKKLEQN